MNISELNSKITTFIRVAVNKIFTNPMNKKNPKIQPGTIQLKEQRKQESIFCNKFSTIDQLQKIKRLIKGTTEYNMYLQMAFTDFHKTFKSTEPWAIMQE